MAHYTMPALSVAGESPLYGLSTKLAKRALGVLIMVAYQTRQR